ncbi:hypothetical protein EWB00_008960 [Schistosoma japonicum]|uniref:Uncharacterized protein n=1 Tax=Schistosoma japonicum TaxID=6182 RepID=A0A4Z2CNH4_SCHJA|nr:hypothetical protein EWB00_008960 [Schistosoma japonicum]
MMSIVVDYRKHVKENTLYAYNQKITRLKSRLRNVSSNQSIIDANSLEEKLNDVASINQHELHKRYWSTNDILSYECISNKNPSWCHSKHTEYRRANLDDRLGVHLNSMKFSWSQSESWLIVQNTIINVILCKQDQNINEAIRNMRQLRTSGVETAAIIEYCSEKVLRNTMHTLRRPLEKLNGDELIRKLVKVWKYYIFYSFPIILLIFNTLSVPHKTIEQMLGAAFLKYILEKLKIEDIISKQNIRIYPHIGHMYYILLTFCSDSLSPNEIQRYNLLFAEHILNGSVSISNHPI